jgi:excinuclease ABC subunit A
MAIEFIKIRGAKANNLKNINIDIPRNKLVVITGLSGSGKSSLAFDTIYAEGQRRYVESLSAYAQQFVGLMDKPPVDLIEGLSPAIAIDQRTIGNNPRSTVGTITEIYDHLRLLFARVGTPYCPNCDIRLKKEIIKKENKKNNEKQVAYNCLNCDFSLAPLEPRNFSFNSNYGACLACGGLGKDLEVDHNLVFNHNLSIEEGAIKPLSKINLGGQKEVLEEIYYLANRHSISLKKSLKDLELTEINIILKGDNQWPGLANYLLEKYKNTKSSFVRQEVNKYLKSVDCPSCQGKKLQAKFLAVKFEKENIYQVSQKSINNLSTYFNNIFKKNNLTSNQLLIAEPIIKEIIKKLEFLSMVGLNYLSLDRSSISLSGGEAQRIRLASQVGSNLSGVVYVLDEPSIGLHQKDNEKLIEMLKNLRDNGNSVIVVEHDEVMMKSADFLVDIGPGAGEDGGEIIFSGEYKNILQHKDSLTGAYLSKKLNIPVKEKFRKGNGKKISIIGAKEHNLKNIDVDIPLGQLIAITGVSGSGKSTLISDILAKSLNKKFYRAKSDPGKHEKIEGIENINKVIAIDQSPIGRTPRSNPATYTGAFTYIRDLFASLPEAKVKGLKAGHFSFNVVGGRCEKCAGDGVIKVEMQFLSDIYLTCDLCQGRRFKDKVLEVKYKDKNIYEVLNLTINQALEFFTKKDALREKLLTLSKVGLGYIKLGQSATTFSGGEAQRIKLATELSRRSTGKTLYILDEPTTGLHFADIEKLLKVLNMLVDQGNTVLIIEHNLDVIKSVDHIIDLGPEEGEKGGFLIANGTPKEIIKEKKSWTAKYLKQVLKD